MNLEVEMQNQFSRTELLIGKENMERLQNARVAIFGIGGVGSYVTEALARSGIGTLDLIDNDKVCLSNLNRQIIATYSTLGMYKVDVAKERILDINPKAVVNVYKVFFLPETAALFDFSKYHYVVDAIDTVTGKIELVERCKSANTPIISSMGTGNKMETSSLMVADINETSVCPLARVMRRELKKRGIAHLKVVYSSEPAKKPKEDFRQVREYEEETETDKGKKRQIAGSNAFVPAAAGLMLAGEVVKDIITM